MGRPATMTEGLAGVGAADPFRLPRLHPGNGSFRNHQEARLATRPPILGEPGDSRGRARGDWRVRGVELEPLARRRSSAQALGAGLSAWHFVSWRSRPCRNRFSRKPIAQHLNIAQRDQLLDLSSEEQIERPARGAEPLSCCLHQGLPAG